MTVGHCSCPVTQQTPPKTCCSGSWKVNSGTGTSLTGERWLVPEALKCPSLCATIACCSCLSFCLCSTQSTKKPFGGSSTQTHTWGGGGSYGGSCHLRSHQPAQPFIQDPAMPPLPPPNTLAQLEEACRRLEEVSTKTTKQRYTGSSC